MFEHRLLSICVDVYAPLSDKTPINDTCVSAQLRLQRLHTSADFLQHYSLVNLLQRSIIQGLQFAFYCCTVCCCVAAILQCLADHEAATTQSRPGGQDLVPPAAGQARGGGGWRQTKMGQQDPVYADLCGVLRGTWKRLAFSLPLPKSRRRQVWCFNWLIAVFPFLIIIRKYSLCINMYML